MSQVNLSVGVVDNTKQGLSSAFSNVTNITNKLAKQLVLEVQVAFPNIANKTKDLESQLKTAYRKMGAVDFVGTRLGKNGKELGLLGFDGGDLRKNMSLDAVKGYIDQLKTIQDKLNNNTLVSANSGKAFEQEKKKIQSAIDALNQYKNTLELIFRTNAKYNTQLTTNSSKTALSADEKRLAILEKIKNVEARYNAASSIQNKIARLNEERASIGSLIPLYEQLIAIDKKRGVDTTANQAILNALRQELAERKNNIEAQRQLNAEQKKASTLKKASVSMNSTTKDIKAQRIANQEAYEDSLKTNADKQRFAQQEYALVSRLRQAWESYRQKMVEAGKSTTRLDDRIASLRAEEQQLYRNIQATRNLRNAERDFNNKSRVWNRLGGLVSRYMSIYMVGNFVRKVAETTGWFQQQQVAMEGILKSATQAREVLSDIKDFALQSPFQTKELVQYTKQLSAFGVETKALFPTVKELADISAGLGVDMSRIILAYGQVKSATILRGQELRQFTEAGIPMVEELAKRLSIETYEVFDKISKRQVSFEDVASVLSGMAGEGGKFYKMQENVTNTLYGQIQKLRDLWTIAMNDIGDGAGSMINKIVKLLQYVVSNAKTVAAALAAAFAGSWLARALTGFGSIVDRLKVMARWLRTSLTLQKALAGFVGGAVAGIAIGALVKIVEQAKKLKNELDKITETYNKENDKMVDSLDSLAKKINVAKIGTKEYNDAVNTLAQNYGSFISKDVIAKLQSQGSAAEQTAKEFGELAESIKEAAFEYNEYMKLKEQRDTSEENVWNNEIARDWNQTLSNLVNKPGESVLSAVSSKIESTLKEKYKRDITFKDITDYKNDLFKVIVEKYVDSKNFEDANFKQIVQEVFKEKIPNLTEDNLKSIAEAGLSAIKENKRAQKALEKISDLTIELENSKYYLKRKFFDAVDPNTTVGFTDNNLQFRSNTEAAYVEALHKTLQLDEYKDYAKNLSKELKDILANAYQYDEQGRTIAKNFDSNTVNRISELLLKFKDTFDDKKAKKWVDTMRGIFLENVEVKTGRAAIVADAIKKKVDKLLENASDENNNETKAKIWQDFSPSDENYNQIRKSLPGLLKEVEEDIKSYRETTKKDESHIAELKLRKSIISELMGKNYFNIGAKKNGGSSAEQIPNELSDFFDDLKNAYQRYKEASQKGGYTMGVEYVKLDERFNEMFGKFFQGNAGAAFKELSKLKIGKNTIFDILKDKFISGGLEDGILNFEDAISSLIKELNDYGKADKKNRKAYLNFAKQLDQWATTNFSKDRLSIALKELEKEVSTLTTSFENTNSAIELYRELQKKGTADVLGKDLGVEEEAMSSDTSRLINHILELRDTISSDWMNSGREINVETLKLGDLNNISDIDNAIKNIGSLLEMNDETFSATEFGDNANALIKALQKLKEAIFRERKDISSEVYTGDEFSDKIANTLKEFESFLPELIRRSEAAGKYNINDMSVIKEYADKSEKSASEIFDAFMKDNRLDIIAGRDHRVSTDELDALENRLKEISKDFPKALKDELMSKLNVLRSEVDKYNASIGAYSTFSGAIKSYRGADDNAKEQYKKEEENYNNIAKQLHVPELRVLLSNEEIIEFEAALALSKERLKEMGKDGEKLADELERAALENLQKSLAEMQDQFNSMVDVLNSIVSAAKAFSRAINDAYDVLHDGENPEWMQDMDAFLNDFAEAFEGLIAPITAVIALVAALASAAIALDIAFTPLLIIMAAVIGLAAVIAGIIAAIKKHDNDLQKTIEDLEKSISRTENAIKNLEAASERLVGMEKMRASVKALSLSYNKYTDALKKANAEEKKHNTDFDKLEEYNQETQEYLDEFLNGLKDWREEMTFSVESVADSISQAMRDAFQNGENAARSMGNVVKETIGDVIEQMMKMSYLEPAIQGAYNKLLGGSPEKIEERYRKSNGEMDLDAYLDYMMGRLNSDDVLSEFEKDIAGISAGYIDMYNSMSETMKEYFAYNSSKSSLSGGISGITEDTARHLEGLQNAMLTQLIFISQGMTDLSRGGFAQVQTSWFNDLLLQTRIIQTATSEMNQAIKDMRNGVRPMSVKISN